MGELKGNRRMLKAGASEVCITPPLGIKISGYFEERVAKDVHDDLFARSLVLDDGETRVAIVVCDLIGVGRAYLDRAKGLIDKRCGIPPSNVLVSCTHTHTGPEVEDMGYGEILIHKIADSVQLACNALSEAEVGFEKEREEKPLGNRRFFMRDGTVWTNPGTLNPNIVKPAGPVDPDIGVLCARGLDGRAICLLANYAMHYAGLSPTEKREDMYTISADYFGVFSEMAKRMLGGKPVAILANGACGDVIMFDAMKPHKEVNKYFGHAERVAALVAAKAVWALNQMEFHRTLKLGAEIEELTIPRRVPTEEEITLARKLARGEIEARNMRHYSLKYFFAPKIEGFQRGPKEVKTWVQALAFGRAAAIVGLPGEIFVEHGLRIKKESPFDRTFVFELANDSVDYVPTARAFKEDGPLASSGGYETSIGPNILIPEAGDMMVESALRMLGKLHGRA
ncbi:MAG: hypothetical protein JTT11_00710 [Candidatus Brockarchaeota archaeon]|nr:hypothetical protein [Candidatus Brockarchaeota archaeon]